MPIKSTKIKSKKSEETPLEKIRRERLEKEAQELKEAEDKKIADEKELTRKKELITEYLDQLEERLEEKNHAGFWTFPDRTGFKKIVASTIKMEKTLNKDSDKYVNRQIAEYVIMFHQNKKSDSMFSGLWLSVTIRMYDIKEKSETLILVLGKECNISWTIDDFAISKFSFKLIERFMKPLAEKKTSCVSIFGKPLKFVLERYKKDAKVDFSDVLQPLKNI